MSRFTWLALFAMLSFALAPTISQALSLGAADPWSQVCSASKPVGSPGAGPQAPAGAASTHAHCPLCCAQPHAFGLPPHGLMPWLLPDGHVARVHAALDDARPQRLGWTEALARGPPVSH